MSYRYDEQTGGWVVADSGMSSSEMTTTSEVDDHKHDDVEDEVFSPSAPSPNSSQHSASASASMQSSSSSSSSKAKRKKKSKKNNRQSTTNDWSDDENFEYVAGDEHHDNDTGSGYPMANNAPSSTSRWFSPSAYISIPSGTGPQQDSSYRGDPSAPRGDSNSPSILRCFREFYSCFAAIWRAVKQPFYQNLGLIFCFVSSAGLMFGLGLIFAAPAGVDTEPIIECELGELGEGMSLRPSCANFTEVPLGTECTWSCDTGYDVAGGTAKRTCQADSTWSGKPLRCEKEPEVLACSVPMAPAGASLEPSDECAKVSQDVPVNTACMWVCDDPLESVGGNMNRECREDGTWSGEPLECKVVTDDGDDGDDDDDGHHNGDDNDEDSDKDEDGGDDEDGGSHDGHDDGGDNDKGHDSHEDGDLDPETTTSKPQETTPAVSDDEKSPVIAGDDDSNGGARGKDDDEESPAAADDNSNNDGDNNNDGGHSDNDDGDTGHSSSEPNESDNNANRRQGDEPHSDGDSS